MDEMLLGGGKVARVGDGARREERRRPHAVLARRGVGDAVREGERRAPQHKGAEDDREDEQLDLKAHEREDAAARAAAAALLGVLLLLALDKLAHARGLRTVAVRLRGGAGRAPARAVRQLKRRVERVHRRESKRGYHTSGHEGAVRPMRWRRGRRRGRRHAARRGRRRCAHAGWRHVDGRHLWQPRQRQRRRSGIGCRLCCGACRGGTAAALRERREPAARLGVGISDVLIGHLHARRRGQLGKSSSGQYMAEAPRRLATGVSAQ